jgi:hypothetical protein
MVGVTTRVIAHSRANTIRNLANIAQQSINGHRSKLIMSLQRIIQIGNVGLMVLVMVYLHCLCVNVRL